MNHLTVASKAGPRGSRQIASRPLQRGCLGRRGGIVQRQEAFGLEALGALHRLADDLCALIGRFEARLAYTGLMQQDVALRATGRLYEAVSLGDIEPFDQPAHFEADSGPRRSMTLVSIP